jgi:hypothetical protein
VKAFVPPSDPTADDLTTNFETKSSTSYTKTETEKVKPPVEKMRKERSRQNSSIQIPEERPKSSQSRPSSAALIGPKRKIGATTSEPSILTPRNGSENNISVGFDCRSQRVTQTAQEKQSFAEIPLKELVKEIEAMQDDEKRVDITTPQHRRGLHSSEDAKRIIKQDDDEESIQWKKIIPLEETKFNEPFAGDNNPLTTLDTAMDWQQVQNLPLEEEDDDKDDEDSWHSPR